MNFRWLWRWRLNACRLLSVLICKSSFFTSIFKKTFEIFSIKKKTIKFCLKIYEVNFVFDNCKHNLISYLFSFWKPSTCTSPSSTRSTHSFSALWSRVIYSMHKRGFPCIDLLYIVLMNMNAHHNLKMVYWYFALY